MGSDGVNRIDPTRHPRSHERSHHAVEDDSDFLIFLSFPIVPYRSDARSRRLAPACKYGAEAGFGARFWS